MSNDSISFIIPIYNSEKTLEVCIESIIKQKANYDIEIILINDGSTDGSEAICNKYSNMYKFVKYFMYENQGVSIARNHGIQMATKNWICFVDSDDKLADNALEYLNQVTNKSDSKIIMLGDGSNPQKSVSVNNDVMKYATLSRKGFRKVKLCSNMFWIWTCWGAIYDREFICQNNLQFPGDLTLR